jgi:hypothetical protein
MRCAACTPVGSVFLGMLVWLCAPGPAEARDAERALLDPTPRQFVDQALAHARSSPFLRQQGDTVWFGGHDGAGYAVEGGIWDFEGDGGEGDFQGWISLDQTVNTAGTFGRVTAEEFSEDPCVPIFPGTVGQIWCGIHEEEAYQLDYVTGMGYGNRFCHYARSAKFAPGDVSVSFDYFCDSELDYDYTYLYVICFDDQGTAWPDGELPFGFFHGIQGSYQAPETYSGGLPGSHIPAWADSIAFEIRFVSDFGWSDEDGLYDSACGAFAADNIELIVGDQAHLADFEEGNDGYSFGCCPGAGTFMGLVHEATYSQWLEDAGILLHDCKLSGWALEFNDEDNSPYTIPGHPELQREAGLSAIVDRTAIDPQLYNTTVVTWDAYYNLPHSSGVFYRPGFTYYPFTTEANPQPRWSPLIGQNTFYFAPDPTCRRDMSTLNNLNSEMPLPEEYEQVRFMFEVYSSCEVFGIPPEACTSPGDTKGAPLIDNVKLGLTYRPDAPVVGLETGHQWHDGFGQRYPTYLDPADVGNADIAVDWSQTNVVPDLENDWLGDSAMIIGPTPYPEERRWWVDLCFRIARKGPLQDAIPEYLAWKARLAGDPETDFVCVLMDSLETAQGVSNNKFVTYFHEEDPGFDPAYPDRSPEQEILPDSLWVPGTRIEYYYRSYWYNGGAAPDEYYLHPAHPAEFEILPGMQSVSGEPYEIQWPTVLYIDAFNRGSQYYMTPMLEAIGLSHDRYDYLHASSGWHAPLRRSFGGTTFNPGGWGNNGMSDGQALGYRLIILDTGGFGPGTMERKDWALFTEWIQATQCGLTDVRRGLLFVGDEIAQIMAQHEPAGLALLRDVFGADAIDRSIREYGPVEDDCIYLLPSDPYAYEGLLPWTLYGNGPQNLFNFNVLGLSGVAGAIGNLNYSDGVNEWQFAEVVRDQVGVGPANWRSAITGFGLYHMSYDGCAGELCRADSACIVEAGADFLQATLDWMTAGAAPFDPWYFDCGLSNAHERTTHLSGPVTHLYPSRPNPFHGSATIRFNLARCDHVQLTVYDVNGRRVRDLLDAPLAGPEEHRLTWDGTDDAGHPVQAGVYWMQLSTASGHESVRRMLTIR